MLYLMEQHMHQPTGLKPVTPSLWEGIIFLSLNTIIEIMDITRTFMIILRYIKYLSKHSIRIIWIFGITHPHLHISR